MGTTALAIRQLRVRAVNKLISMYKKIIISSLFLLAIIFTFNLITPNYALADETLNGLNATAGSVGAFRSQVSNPDNNFIQTKAGQIIGTVLSFVGVIFLILMIVAGVRWMTAQGNDQQVTKAKDQLINAIIGLVIIFAAYAITNFVGNFVTTLTN